MQVNSLQNGEPTEMIYINGKLVAEQTYIDSNADGVKEHQITIFADDEETKKEIYIDEDRDGYYDSITIDGKKTDAPPIETQTPEEASKRNMKAIIEGLFERFS